MISPKIFPFLREMMKKLTIIPSDLSLMEVAILPSVNNPAGTGGSRPARRLPVAPDSEAAAARDPNKSPRPIYYRRYAGRRSRENAAICNVTSAGFTIFGLSADRSRPPSPFTRRDVLRNFTALLRHTKLGHLRGLGLKERA
jgi:hypothetical protein